MKTLTQNTWIPLGVAVCSAIFLGGGIMWLDAIYAKTNQNTSDIGEIKKTYEAKQKDNAQVLQRIREDLVEIKTDIKYMRKHQ